MDRYEVVRKLGEGSYGFVVYQAIDKLTGETVTIKNLKKKYDSCGKCLNLPEVNSLMEMNNHPHIVKLKEIITESDNILFVFEYIKHNLHDLLDVLVSFSGDGVLVSIEKEIRDWCFQIFQALAYVHKSGYIHGDLNLENLLFSVLKDGSLDIKLADSVFKEDMSTTLWYRAPELLLGSSRYGTPVDMWSAGLIMAQLFSLYPLCPGQTELDQMCEICGIFGSPNGSWAEGLQIDYWLNFQFQFAQCSGADLSVLIPRASTTAINLITSLCSWDPRKRPTAAEALCHPFFNGCYHIPRSLPLMAKQGDLCDISEAKTTHASFLNAAAAREERKLEMEFPLMTQTCCSPTNFSTANNSFFPMGLSPAGTKKTTCSTGSNERTSTVSHISVNKVVPSTRQQEAAAAAATTTTKNLFDTPPIKDISF